MSIHSKIVLETICDSSAPSDLASISDTGEAVFMAFDNDERIDLSGLKDVPLVQINWMHLVTVLRATFMMRNVRVIGWREGVQIARAAIEFQGKENATEILAGLEN